MSSFFEVEPERYEFHEQPWLLGSQPIGRREFFRRIGGGLVVLCFVEKMATESGATGEAAVQESLDRGARRPTEIAAWLHVAGDGSITAYTGKVEVGQNARTSLTLAVAEELNVKPGSIQVVMGDTAQVPYDRGTFGSRTSPEMFLMLRRASASARDVLIQTAAEQWQVPTEGLTAVDGRVHHEESGRSIPYGELTAGKELLQAIREEIPLTEATAWEVAGRRLPKVNGRAFVTGRHAYASDHKIEGMGHGKVLNPPALGAHLASFDASAAESMPGVIVIRDGDFAGVIANTDHEAEAAIKAIKAEWVDPAPTCSDSDLSEYLKDKARSDNSNRGSISKGNLEEGFQTADIQLEQTYTAAFIAHVPLEPRTCVAAWDDDRLTVWTGTQVPFGVRSGLARHFEIPEERVRVIVLDTGSGYGGKHSPEAEIEAARLARAAKRPVRRARTRPEEFTQGYLRPAGLVEARVAARDDGTILAWEYHNYNSGTAGLEPPYAIPNVRAQFHPTDSPLRQGSYRALASTFNHFARETLLNELAEQLKIDPLQLRLKNLKDERLVALLKATAEHYGWAEQPRKEGVGHGIACGHDKGSCTVTIARARVEGPRKSIRVESILAGFEAGTIIQPDQLANQVEGAVVQGLGGALFERIRFRDGTIRNAQLSRYRVPRFRDLPKIEVHLLDRKDLPPAGGGEIPIVTVAPAIAAAVHAATGEWRRDMPMAP